MVPIAAMLDRSRHYGPYAKRLGPWLVLMAAIFVALSPSPAQADTNKPFLLIVYASGGLDQAMVYDPKGTDSVVAQESGAAAASSGNLTFVDHPSRPSVKNFFTTYGGAAVVVNGVKTSYLDRTLAYVNNFGTVPPSKSRVVDWGTLYASQVFPAKKLPHLAIEAPIMPGDYIGNVARITTAGLANLLGSAPGDSLGSGGEKAIAEMRKVAMAKINDAVPNQSLDSERIKALTAAFASDEALETALTTAVKTLGATPADFAGLGQLAVELMAQGTIGVATVQAGRRGAFDVSSNHYAHQSQLIDGLFSGLNSILAYAAKRSLTSQLIVIVLSDFGRAPALNSRGGKGAWPYTSVLLWGSVLNGGTVLGATDLGLRAVAIDPVFGKPSGINPVVPTLANIFATLFLKAGVPLKSVVQDGIKPLAPLLKAKSS